MAQFYGRVQLQGHTATDRTTLVYDLGDLALPADAVAAMLVIRNALQAVTNAVVRQASITQLLESDGTRPSDPSSDTFEEAAIITLLNEEGEAEKMHVVRIPAPVIGLFLDDHQTVNTSNAALQAYVSALADHVFVSDGEKINSALDNSGIKYGYKRSKSRRFRGQ